MLGFPQPEENRHEEETVLGAILYGRFDVH
jgi:hypothetical protein